MKLSAASASPRRLSLVPHVVWHAVTHSATAASNTYLASAFRPGDPHYHWQHHASITRLCRQQMARVVADWHRLPWAGAEKYQRPLVGSLSWINLVFGESIAVGLQGIAQARGLQDSLSFAISVVAALVVELAFTYPIAARNVGEQPTVRRVTRAMATAFWLGGAMGVENERLPRRAMLAPIGAYMVFGVLLAIVAEHDNLAQKLVESPWLLAVLVLAGIIKKVNGVFEYPGVFERLAEGSVGAIEKLFQPHTSRKSPRPRR